MRTFRRVVTGHDENGKAVVIEDSEATCTLERETRPGVRLTNFWAIDSIPVDLSDPSDPVTGPLVLHPPKGGAIFRVVEYQPEDPEVIAKIDPKEAFGAMGAADNVVEGARHPYMHRTESIDFAIILSGEIDMLLDEEDVPLKAGDMVIQRGTNHAWANRYKETCQIAFILIDAIPDTVGKT